MDGNRNNFVHQLACNCNRQGIPEIEALSFILSQYNYDEKEIRAAVSSAYKNTQEHGNFVLPSGKNKKWETPVPHVPPVPEPVEGEASTVPGPVEGKTPKRIPYIDRIENFLNERYEFRHNLITGKLELRSLPNLHFNAINDFQENSLLRELLKAGLKCNSTVLRAILNSDFCKLFNPFDAYFSSLPPWDGQTDYISQLADTVTTTKQDHWQYCFKKWIVAMVGCVLDDKTVNHTVIVFSGKQGVGKTTWMEHLVPAYLKNYLFSGTINPNNKDTLIHLAECMLINLDELENLNRTEIGSLKEIITKTQIRVRKAYGHNSETLPRRASFTGSVNTAQFLNDTTGSRRFLCFEVTDIQYRHGVAIDNVYSQALHLYKSGFRFWFDKSEIETITSNNEQYQFKSVEEELLLTWFIPVNISGSVGSQEGSQASPSGGGLEGAGASFLNASQIAARLAEKAKITITDGTIMKLGKALKKHGFHRLKKGGNYVYAVRELSWEEVTSQNERKELETQEVNRPLVSLESRLTPLPKELDFPEDEMPF